MPTPFRTLYRPFLPSPHRRSSHAPRPSLRSAGRRLKQRSERAGKSRRHATRRLLQQRRRAWMPLKPAGFAPPFLLRPSPPLPPYSRTRAMPTATSLPPCSTHMRLRCVWPPLGCGVRTRGGCDGCTTRRRSRTAPSRGTCRGGRARREGTQRGAGGRSSEGGPAHEPGAGLRTHRRRGLRPIVLWVQFCP